MTTGTSSIPGGTSVSRRAHALAERLVQGASALEDLARGLTPAEWQARIPGDGRTVGVVVHHVANMYPIEIELAQLLAAGRPIAGVTWDVVKDINAKHADAHGGVTVAEAVDLLRRNSAEAAAAIHTLTDEQLDQAAPISLNSDAPLTCQFFLEDHAVRHSYHHAARIRAALSASAV